jgi:hypothetical protein
MPPPSLPPERANVADFYAARSGLIPSLPRPTFSPAFSPHRFKNILFSVDWELLRAAGRA